MGNSISDDECQDVAKKAIIPFRVRNNGFQVDYKIFKFNAFTKAKTDEVTDTKYDDSFLELNTRAKIVGDIHKVFTISAESISEDYAALRRNYYSRIFFGVLTFVIGMILTNIGLVQNELPKGRIMIIFGGLLLILCVITFIIVVYTDRRLKMLNKEFVQECVKILDKEKIVTWTASFQHLLFDIIYPYNGKSGVGAVILTPNPYFEVYHSKETDTVKDKLINVDEDRNQKLPVPRWAIEQSVSKSNENENQPFLKNKGNRNMNRLRDQSLILPPSDENEDDIKYVISAAEHSDESSSTDDDECGDIIQPPSDDADNEDEEDDLNNNNDDNPLINNDALKGALDNASAPKAYTGFDDVSAKNAQKIHGELVQRYFHDNPEDIEGHGEDTALAELMANQQLLEQHHLVQNQNE